MASYKNFCDRDYDGSVAKAFKEHHDSCKAAISHVELLLKLSEKFDLLSGGSDNDHAILATMIESARGEVGRYKDIVK